MEQVFHEITIDTTGQGLYNFTNKTISWFKKQSINNGMLNINILHTSASLVIQENADPDVLYDLKNFFVDFGDLGGGECKLRNIFFDIAVFGSFFGLKMDKIGEPDHIA